MSETVAKRKQKCICPDAETLREYFGSVINWPRWNLDDCPVHKGENPALENAAEKLEQPPPNAGGKE